VGRLDQVDSLFTDCAPPAAFTALLAEAGVRCVTADTADTAAPDPGDTPP
jgi:DeoR/GlpR family transcriptional regulator of sugar metabolism